MRSWCSALPAVVLTALAAACAGSGATGRVEPEDTQPSRRGETSDAAAAVPVARPDGGDVSAAGSPSRDQRPDAAIGRAGSPSPASSDRTDAGVDGAGVDAGSSIDAGNAPQPSQPESGDRRCAQLRAAHANVVFCEDFEDPGLRAPAPHRSGHLWYDRYGPSSHGDCHGTPEDSCPNGRAPLAQFVGEDCPAGDSDCLHDGSFTFAISHAPCGSGGNVALAQLSKTVKSFGVTVAQKYGANFLANNGQRSSCDGAPETVHAGYKIHRWIGPGQAAKHTLGGHGNGAPGGCVLAGGGSAASQAMNFPFGAGWQTNVCGTPTQPCGALPAVALGSACKHDVGVTIHPDRSLYEWGRTKQPGDWICLQYHYENWGSANARARYWVDGVLVADVSADMTDVRSDSDGVNQISIENYYNGGYRGTSTAYRYEDNLVVTEGAPVQCSEIGFRSLP